MIWAERAEAAQRVLTERFWDDGRGVFRVTARRRLLGMPHWHYWWQAHALDALVDAAIRRGARPAGRDLVGAHVTGILRRNGGGIVNDYYDDMAWMGLALLRADDLTGVDTAGLVRELWADIRGGWDRRHGGVLWRRGDTYTNAAANGPAAVLAARLHARDGDPADLEWARRIDGWLRATLVDQETGLVWDGVHPGTDSHPRRELYTYNQGSVVGAGVELYRATRDLGHLAQASRAAAAALSRLPGSAAGLPPAEGTGDGGLFKGILARYLGELVLAALESPPGGFGASGPVPSGVRETAGASLGMLATAGTSVAPVAATDPVGPDWTAPAAEAGSLSTHLSAVLLLETVARLEAAGLVGREPVVRHP